MFAQLLIVNSYSLFVSILTLCIFGMFRSNLSMAAELLQLSILIGNRLRWNASEMLVVECIPTIHEEVEQIY